MAVTLSIDITDAEQAKIEEWLDILLPGKTPAEKKAILEKHAKRMLREDLLTRIDDYRTEESRITNDVLRSSEENLIVVEDVFDPSA